jgi:hypothetical protein
MTSKWNQSASLLLIISHSLCKFAKSEANNEGAIDGSSIRNFKSPQINKNKVGIGLLS